MARNRFDAKVIIKGPGLKKGPVAEVMSEDLFLRLGIFGAKAKVAHNGGNGKTVAEIMSIHEFGLGGMPERSFIRAWIDDNRALIRRDLRKVLQRAATSRSFTVEDGLKLLGLKYEGLIKGRISQGIPPPNAPSTIRQKGSSKPLIDTGQARSSITHEVVKGKP